MKLEALFAGIAKGMNRPNIKTAEDAAKWVIENKVLELWHEAHAFLQSNGKFVQFKWEGE
jgi:hypothetical protein